MNKKLDLYAAFSLLLAPFLTGCMATTWASRRISGPHFNKFKPEAVYRRDKPVSFALEGMRETRDGSFRAFLIVDDDLLERANAQTNQTLSLHDIEEAYKLLALEGNPTRRKLPPDYIRVGVLPKNDLALDAGTYYTGAGWNFVVPFAFIADVATFPLQIIYVAAGGDPGWRF